MEGCKGLADSGKKYVKWHAVERPVGVRKGSFLGAQVGLWRGEAQNGVFLFMGLEENGIRKLKEEETWRRKKPRTVVTE